MKRGLALTLMIVCWAQAANAECGAQAGNFVAALGGCAGHQINIWLKDKTAFGGSLAFVSSDYIQLTGVGTGVTVAVPIANIDYFEPR